MSKHGNSESAACSLSPPDHLSPDAADFWDRAVEACEAEGIRLATRWDAMQRYAVTYELWWDCVQGIRAEGQTVTADRYSEHGMTSETKRNPRMVDYGRLTALLASIAAELGLSAKARKIVEAGGRVQDSGDDDGPISYKIG